MKRGLAIILAFCLFSQLYLISAATQSGSSIVVNVDGTTRGMEDSSTYFIGSHTYAAPSAVGRGQHDASQVWVSVQDGEMTLLQALQSTNRLKPNPSNPTTYASSPADKTKPYHFGTEITYGSGSLQSAINSGTFVSAPVYTYSWISGTWSAYAMVNTCDAQRTRIVTCQRNDGTPVADSYCTQATKPYTTNVCSECRWRWHNAVNVIIGTEYCTIESRDNPCTAASLADPALPDNILCQDTGGCFFLWCDGGRIICTAHPLGTWCY